MPPAPRRLIQRISHRLPLIAGSPIRIRFRPNLKAHRGKLLSGASHPGTPVHAAGFIPQREIILETNLLKTAPKLRLILVHEIFHFVWARLGNNHRAAFTALITAEINAKARGELGESALAAKHADRKTYICESFCDTAAWLFAGVKTSPDFTLASRWRKPRKSWFLLKFASAGGGRC